MKNSRKICWGGNSLVDDYVKIFILFLVIFFLFVRCAQDPTGACTKKYWDSFEGEWVYTCLGNMTYEGCQNDYQQWGQAVDWDEDQTCWEICPTCDNIFED